MAEHNASDADVARRLRPAAQVTRARGPSVLVVDDHLEMAQMLADGLQDFGYVAVAVASGRKAIETLAHEYFDVVVTDLRM